MRFEASGLNIQVPGSKFQVSGSMSLPGLAAFDASPGVPKEQESLSSSFPRALGGNPGWRESRFFQMSGPPPKTCGGDGSRGLHTKDTREQVVRVAFMQATHRTAGAPGRLSVH
jgi:hypothetical protein